MFASTIPTLPWARLFPFAAFLVFGAVTLAWWWFTPPLNATMEYVNDAPTIGSG
jgi:hypothetical protein